MSLLNLLEMTGAEAKRKKTVASEESSDESKHRWY